MYRAKQAYSDSHDVVCAWKQIDRALAATSSPIGDLDRAVSQQVILAQKRDAHYVFSGLVFC